MRIPGWLELTSALSAARRRVAGGTRSGEEAEPVPELSGLSQAAARDYAMRQIQEWLAICDPEQAATFGDKLDGASRMWSERGLQMPDWGHLWILRTYQRELGLQVPAVVPLTELGLRAS